MHTSVLQSRMSSTGSQELDSLRHLQVHGAWRDSVPPIDLESKKQSTINDLMVDWWLVSSSKIAERPSTAGWPSTPPAPWRPRRRMSEEFTQPLGSQPAAPISRPASQLEMDSSKPAARGYWEALDERLRLKVEGLGAVNRTDRVL